METLITICVVFCIVVLAVGYTFMFNQPYPVRKPDGTVDIKCRAAPLKEFVRYTAIVVTCSTLTGAFVALISV